MKPIGTIIDSAKIERILKMRGISVSDIAPPKPSYACNKCMDVGFVRLDLPITHPDFAKPVPCECRKLSRKSILKEKSQLAGKLKEANFASFLTNEENRTAHAAALSLCRKGNGWLTLCGNYGTGKSTLLASAVNYHLDLGTQAVYFTLADLFDSLKDEGFSHYSTLMEELKRVKCLAIDEIDKANLTDWAGEKLYQLFDHRYNRIDDLITLYAMNKSPQQMIKDGSGLDRHHYDRMREEGAYFIEMKGKSNRPIVKAIQGIVGKMRGGN